MIVANARLVVEEPCVHRPSRRDGDQIDSAQSDSAGCNRDTFAIQELLRAQTGQRRHPQAERRQHVFGVERKLHSIWQHTENRQPDRCVFAQHPKQTAQREDRQRRRIPALRPDDPGDDEGQSQQAEIKIEERRIPGQLVFKLAKLEDAPIIRTDHRDQALNRIPSAVAEPVAAILGNAEPVELEGGQRLDCRQRDRPGAGRRQAQKSAPGGAPAEQQGAG